MFQTTNHINIYIYNYIYIPRATKTHEIEGPVKKMKKKHVLHFRCFYLMLRRNKYTREIKQSRIQLWHQLINIASGAVERPGEKELGRFRDHWAPTH